MSVNMGLGLGGAGRLPTCKCTSLFVVSCILYAEQVHEERQVDYVGGGSAGISLAGSLVDTKALLVDTKALLFDTKRPLDDIAISAPASRAPSPT